MKKSDPLTQHHDRMRELHLTFLKKAEYHTHKSYLELKDVYWLAHEFFTTFLERNHNFTEEELMKEIKEFKHEFYSMPQDTVDGWRAFLQQLSRSQYSGTQLDQMALHEMLKEFTRLIDETLGRAQIPPDAITKLTQEARIYLQHEDIVRAEEIYRKIASEYESLSQEKRKEHYEQIQSLYKAIADARNASTTAHR